MPRFQQIMTLDKQIMEILDEEVYTTSKRLIKALGYQPKAIQRAITRLNEQGVLDVIKVKTDFMSGRALNAYIKVSENA